MQQATGMKGIVLNHFGSSALVLAVLVSMLTVLATLAATGDIPFRGSDHSTTSTLAENNGVASIAAPDIAAKRELAMERADHYGWAQANRAEVSTPPAADPAARELQMERDEYRDWVRSNAASDHAAR